MTYSVTYRLSDGKIVGWSTGSAREQPGYGVTTLDREPDRYWDRVDVETGRVVDTSDAKFAADLDEKFECIALAMPALRHPVAPEPITPVTRSRFSSSQVWNEFVGRAERGEWKPREFLSVEPVGPFKARGDCLAPVRSGGSLDWYDPLTPARDGDIVLVKWDAKVLEKVYRENEQIPEWIGKYGEASPIATKLLRALGHEYWLVTRNMMWPLGKNQILGVLAQTAPPTSMQIAPNAATDIYTDEDAGPVVFTAGTFGNALLVNFTPEYDGEVQALVVANVATSSADSGEILFLQADVPSRLGVADIPEGTFDTNPRRIVLQVNYPVFAGESVTVNLLAPVNSVDVTITEARLRVELIKK